MIRYVLSSLLLCMNIVGILATYEDCIFCTTEFMWKDPVIDLVKEFTKGVPLSFIKRMRDSDDCMSSIIPSLRCTIHGFESEEIFLHPDIVTLESVKEWFAKEKARLSRRTPMMKNLTNIRLALEEVRPLVFVYTEPIWYKQVDTMFATVKERWPLYNFMILNAEGEHIAQDLENLLGRRIPVQSFAIRQHRSDDMIIGSVHALNPLKLESLLRIASVPENKLMTAPELFHHSSWRKMKKISRPTLVYVFMAWHPHLGYDLHMMNESVHYLRQLGLDFDLRYFSVDTHIDEIRHDREAAFINSLHLIQFSHGEEKVSFTLNTIGPTDLLMALRDKTVTLASTDFEHIIEKTRHWHASSNTGKSHIDEGPQGCRCSNLTETRPASPLKPPMPAFEEKSQPPGPKLYEIPLLDKASWLSLIDSTPSADHLFDLKKKSNIFANKIEVILVIYTIDPGCSHCGNSGPIFYKLMENLQNVRQTFGTIIADAVADNRIKVRVFNCLDVMDFCSKEVGSAGFPAVVAFRRLLVREISHCTEEQNIGGRLSYVRQTYHGVIWTQDLLDWLSQDVLAPSMKQVAQSQAVPQLRDGRGTLVVDVLPPWSKKIPRSPVRKVHSFYCLDCVLFACERLMGYAECFVRVDEAMSDTADATIGDNFVVTRVRFVRADNVSTDIMRVSTPLHLTVDEHGSIHNFHKPHRYHLSEKETCEDNHGRCTDLLIQFTKDHSRLPVTKLSEEFIHRDDTVLSTNMPILVSLVHTSNLTNSNAFFKKMLEALGRRFYDKLIVATLDVDDYPSWANRFVPTDYHSRITSGNEVLPMYRYPRFCMIYWSQHNRAAFYPKVDIGSKQNYTEKEIVNFVNEFLSSPEKLLEPSDTF